MNRIIIYIILCFLPLCAAYSNGIEKKDNIQNEAKIGLKTENIQLGYDRIQKIKKTVPKKEDKVNSKDEEEGFVYCVQVSFMLIGALVMGIFTVWFIIGVLCIIVACIYANFVNKR